jgi:metallo-beta-lactamase family protein
MKVSFWGSTDTVTGSKTILKIESKTFLVDCGLFQGPSELEKRNYDEELPINPSKLDGIFLTHAHLDHCGLIPYLVKKGFKEKIYATKETMELALIIMNDSAEIQAHEIKSHNKKIKKEKLKLKALYTKQDVQKTQKLFQLVKWNEPFEIINTTITYYPAGHILGASSILFKDDNSSITFSGDLGRDDDIIMPPPIPPEESQWIVLESTYGNRIHPDKTAFEDLKEIIADVRDNNRVLIIPVFAVARAQLIFLHLQRLFEKHNELKIPVYVDSPMINEVNQVYSKNINQTQINKSEFSKLDQTLNFFEWQNQSDDLIKKQRPYVIISSSGMISGGRIMKHLPLYSEDSNNVILIVGYQAEGTIGRDILDGKKSVEFENKVIPINSQVKELKYFSAHADHNELINWAKKIQNLKKIFLLHGNQNAKEKLKEDLENHGFSVTCPGDTETFTID